ncbi:MAG TPA: cell division protein FtsQ/DivIB [Pseudolabrys sp.]|nr:cell division protein FtsQ/DivIB [Pseudolabrys sp.]
MADIMPAAELAAQEGITSKVQVAMEGRGRLAQSLKPKRRPSSASWLGLHKWRWPRPLRRWGRALVDLNVPRGAGSSAAALLLLASVGFGAIQGGHGPQIIENVQNLCDAAANRLGFRISEIALAGEKEVGRNEILQLVGITDRSSLLFLDAARARARLLTNPWISEATVLKLYPDRLRIEIRERNPFARWQRDGRIALIAADGTVLESVVPPRFSGLPLVVGKGAEQTGQDFLALVARYPMIAHMTEASVLVAERRWNLRLKGGVEVLLPESEAERALGILVDLDRNKKLLSRDIVTVDLRLPDRVTVRQSDAAAAAREQALKDAEKTKKTKSGKGGEA